jgi:predicted negative regulator of RcsB-dependent stress response
LRKASQLAEADRPAQAVRQLQQVISTDVDTEPTPIRPTSRTDR